MLTNMSDSLIKAFGRSVRELRVSKSLSQERLAELAGIHRTYISSIELGKVRVGLEIAKKVACGLGVNLSDLITAAETSRRSHAQRKH